MQGFQGFPGVCEGPVEIVSLSVIFLADGLVHPKCFCYMHLRRRKSTPTTVAVVAELVDAQR